MRELMAIIVSFALLTAMLSPAIYVFAECGRELDKCEELRRQIRDAERQASDSSIKTD